MLKDAVMMEGELQVYKAANSLEAHVLRGMLQSEGIPVRLSGDSLSGGIGELPTDVAQVTLYVSGFHFERARQLLGDYERRRSLGPWRCARCGEENAASFEVCWQCQSPQR